MERKTTPNPAGETREERRKAALRANLQRRKSQAKARAGTGASVKAGAGGAVPGDDDDTGKEQES